MLSSNQETGVNGHRAPYVNPALDLIAVIRVSDNSESCNLIRNLKFRYVGVEK